MSGTEEKVFLAEEGVTVTNTRFVVPSQIFTMSGVASVTFSKINPNRLFPIALILVALVVGASGKGSIWHVALFLIPGIVWLALLRAKFAVVLSSTSGETRALVSKDQDFVRRVVSALNDAIIARG